LFPVHHQLYVDLSADNEIGEYDATTGAVIAGFTSPSDLSNPVGIALSAAPEPSTWAMMLGGLGLIGGMRRLRRIRQA